MFVLSGYLRLQEAVKLVAVAIDPEAFGRNSAFHNQEKASSPAFERMIDRIVARRFPGEPLAERDDIEMKELLDRMKERRRRSAKIWWHFLQSDRETALVDRLEQRKELALADARNRLRNALGNGALCAEAILPDGSNRPVSEAPWRIKAGMEAMREGVLVVPGHALAPGARWSILLPEAGLKDWLSPQAPASSPQVTQDTPEKRAMEWMRLNVNGPGDWKRDAAIRACRIAACCTDANARAGWDALPSSVKRQRGRPGNRANNSGE